LLPVFLLKKFKNIGYFSLVALFFALIADFCILYLDLKILNMDPDEMKKEYDLD